MVIGETSIPVTSLLTMHNIKFLIFSLRERTMSFYITKKN